MRQTLFFIPHEVFGLEVFGLGWLLIGWLLFSAACLIWLVRRQGWTSDTLSYLPFLGLVAVAIAFVFPIIEAQDPAGHRLGLPIRGYGSFVLLGFGAGLWLAIRRARARGMSVEIVWSLAIWMFVGAFLGARLFFVIEYWDNFRRDTWVATLTEVVRITEGGLVVYGALLGGLPALFLFCRKHRLSPLALGDIVAPSLALGLFFGRLGCLMNGCCYGGVCESGPFCVQFPRYNSVVQRSISPPYEHQLGTGRLHGFTIGTDPKSQRPVVRSVEPGSAAALAGLTAGTRIIVLNNQGTPDFASARRILASSGPRITLMAADGSTIQWSVGSLPPRSLPVHPVQVYSAINALLLCLVLIATEPYLRRRGAVLALTLSVYPVVRIIEEMIRVDEPAQFGTALTISQWISLGVLIAAPGIWAIVLRSPRVPADDIADRGQRLSVA